MSHKGPWVKNSETIIRILTQICSQVCSDTVRYVAVIQLGM